MTQTNQARGLPATRCRLRHAVLVLGLAALPDAAAAQAIPGADSLVTERMAAMHVPGLAAVLVDSGRVVWLGTYGFSDVASRIPVTDSTPFQIASVSKTVTATVLMTLHAAGRFGLDDDVSRYLPFPVRNPRYPDVPITFRQLLNHKSSIRDNYKFFGPLWGAGAGDDLTPLDEFLRGYLIAGGRNYSSEENFLPAPPGDSTQYCNTCYALIGYLAQAISGVPFARLSDSVLFRPLGMRETHWFVREFPPNRAATPHRYAADTGFVAYGQNGYPDWPAGTLRTSIRDLSRFLLMQLGRGALEGRQIVPAGVVDVMAPANLRDGFLTWFASGASTGEVLLGHGGGDRGVATYLGFSSRGRRGVIVLTNGETPVERLARDLYGLMAARRSRP